MSRHECVNMTPLSHHEIPCNYFRESRLHYLWLIDRERDHGPKLERYPARSVEAPFG